MRQLALLILQQRLARPEPVFLEVTIGQIARETLLPNAEVRSRLLSLLDHLEVQRRGQDGVWPRMLEIRGETITPKATEKFLTTLTGEVRRLVAQQNRRNTDYDLRELIKEAGRKAKLSPEQGQHLLLTAMGLGSNCTMPGLAGMPEQIGIQVQVRNSSSPVGADSVAGTVPNGTDGIPPQNIGLPQALMPVLLRELSASERINWVAETPDSSRPPDYLMSVAIQELQDHRAGGQMKRLVKAEIVLGTTDGQTQIYRRPIQVDQYTSIERGDTPAAWDAFQVDIARKVRTYLDEFLSAR